MRLLLEVSDDYYKVSGSLSSNVIDKLSSRFKVQEKKRNSILISRDEYPVDVYQAILDTVDVDIEYNFKSLNDFIGKELLESLFQVAYTNKDFTSDYIDRLQTGLRERLNRLPKDVSYEYPEVDMSDDYFRDCLDQLTDEFQKSRIRVSFDWYYFYRVLSDKTDNNSRESLRLLVKTLFMINFASNVSKSYVAFVLEKFNLKPKSEMSRGSYIDEYYKRLKLLNELEKFNEANKPKKRKSSSDKLVIVHDKNRLNKLFRSLFVDEDSSRKSVKVGKYRYVLKDGILRKVRDYDSDESESSSE